MDYSLNTEQKLALQKACEGHNLFITGGAGTGKSVVLNAIVQTYKFQGKNVIICAPTAAAAQLVNGITIHRAFNIKDGPLLTEKGLKTKIRVDSRLLETDLIIVDEISMCRADLFEVIVGSIKKVEAKRKKKIQLIVIGDFFQLPPVIQDSTNEKEILEAAYGKQFGKGYSFQSSRWEEMNFQTVFLTQTMRASEYSMIENLNKARLGDWECLNFFIRNCQKEPFEDGICLVGLKEEASRINNEKLRKLKNPIHSFKAVLTGDIKESDVVRVPLELSLCQGARVFCKINDYENHLYNGLQGTILNLDDKYIGVQFDGHKEPINISKYTFTVNEYKLNHVGDIEVIELGQYCQFPLELAYSITIHHSQGSTFNKVNLNPYAWDYGQLYVALSRVRNIESLYMPAYFSDQYLKADPLVKEFYSNLINGKTISTKLKKAGKDFNTCTVRIPEFLKEPIQQASDDWRQLGPDDRYNSTILLIPNDKLDQVLALINNKINLSS